MAARGQWFFPIFDRAEFWLRQQAWSLRFFSVFHQVNQGDFLAPRAAVALGFDSDVFLVPMAARGQWFFPIFDRAEFWLRRQARSLRFFQFFTRWIFWLREPQLRLALIPMCFGPHGSPRAVVFSHFFSGRILAQTTGAFLTFFSVFHQVNQVDFLAPRAAVALGFDSDVFLVPMAA